MTLTGVHRAPGRGEGEPLDYAPAVYGALLATTLVTVQWQGDRSPELIGLSLVIAVVAFRLTDVWLEIVAHRVHGPVDASTTFALARRSRRCWARRSARGDPRSLRFFGVDVDVAIGAAVVASLVQLFLWGLAVGRAAHASRGLALLVALVDFGIGLGVAFLKVLVLH